MVANRPVSLPPRPVFLAGREDLLAELVLQYTAAAEVPLDGPARQRPARMETAPCRFAIAAISLIRGR